MPEPNDRKYTKTPYGDNLVARCDDCGKPVHLCICDEDEEDYEDRKYIDDVDAFGRNYSDADLGL